MVTLKGNEMGRFSVEVELANYGDVSAAHRGVLPADQVRRARVRGVVDTGATRLVLPEKVARQLGLEIEESEVAVTYADGRRATRPFAQGIHLTYMGRSSIFNAIIEPNREAALIGALVMEDLDLIPDCRNGTLLPRDPNQIVSEIESSR